MKIYEGKLLGTGIKVGIVISRFNNFISQRLLEGCLDGLKRHNVNDEDIKVYYVPGSFEIPGLAQKIVNKYDGIICLGAVIRGETPHFDYVSNEVSKGIAKVMLDSGKPVTYGIITADTVDQAIDRAGTKAGNKGYDAALSLIETVNLYRNLG